MSRIPLHLHPQPLVLAAQLFTLGARQELSKTVIHLCRLAHLRSDSGATSISVAIATIDFPQRRYSSPASRLNCGEYRRECLLDTTDTLGQAGTDPALRRPRNRGHSTLARVATFRLVCVCLDAALRIWEDAEGAVPVRATRSRTDAAHAARFVQPNIGIEEKQ